VKNCFYFDKLLSAHLIELIFTVTLVNQNMFSTFSISIKIRKLLDNMVFFAKLRTVLFVCLFFFAKLRTLVLVFIKEEHLSWSYLFGFPQTMY